jgi:nucleotide-binding universal stress UspA family protein
MYSRLLIPLDGSKPAEQALPYARCLAKALSVPVELLEAIDSESLQGSAYPEQGRYFDTLLAEKKASSRNYLDTIAASFDGAAVTSTVQSGKAADLIIDKAAGDRDALIMMATHGRSGIQRWIIGSVADKVLHGSTNHLLLIHATENGNTEGEASLKKVIVPLDGSPLAEKVLPHVVELAKTMRIDVTLLRAYALPPAISPEEYGVYSGELINQLESEAKNYLEEKARELRQEGVPSVASILELGYGAEKIIEVARKTPDNFIAICTHGRSGFKRLVLGSVTERVTRHSGDPVLVIRAGL